MTAHSTLTGADLHEPKGTATASANTVYTAGGTGTGVWQKVNISMIDTATIKGANIFFLTVYLNSIASANSVYLPMPVNATLNSISVTQDGVLTTGVTITAYNTTNAIAPTIPITTSGVAGTTSTATVSTNGTFTANTYIKISSSGGGVGTCNLSIVLQLTMY